MKTITSDLQTLLDTGFFLEADLFTFTSVDGTVYRYTSANADLEWNGHTYVHNQLLITRSGLDQGDDLSTDTVDLTISQTPAGLIYSIPFLQTIPSGYWDNAICQVDQAFLYPLPAVSNGPGGWLGATVITGVLTLLVGPIGAFKNTGRDKAKVPVHSFTHLLNITVPRNVYQPGCNYFLYQTPGCGVSQSAYTTSGTVNATATANKVPVSISKASGYYALGFCKFTSGVLNGFTFGIQDYDGTYIYFAKPLPAIPSSGDYISLSAGCDKLMSTCVSKFSNGANYRGFRFIPVVETAAF